MSGYVGDTERRRSGYDEYEGIFGPLQVSGGFYGSRSSRERAVGLSDGSSRWRRRGAARPASFDRRAEFLAKRSEKRMQKGFRGGEDGLNGPEIEEGEPTRRQDAKSGKAGSLMKQVWLPTRRFAFRQRSGKLDTRAIGRLDLEKIVATTDVAVIQRHLENLAFADVTLEDVQQYSDAYFLKLFQISQMTLEYLLHVQDSLVEHSDRLESQCEQLLDECQQLEVENDKQETEIASLKRDIRQKQRTMATLELMLLNATPHSAGYQGANQNEDKENLVRGANALVDELLASSASPEGGGKIPAKPVVCVLCEKRFVSVEYLLRHQQKKHQRGSKRSKVKGKPTKSSGSSSSSSSASSSGKRASKRAPTRSEVAPPPVASLPKEVIDALEEKNQLARQLIELQAQVRAEQEARDAQRRNTESQQTQLTNQLMEHLSRLQSALGDIEKKQETVKADMIKHTEDAIKRMQGEVEAQVALTRRQVSSRVGSIESDPDEATVRPPSTTGTKTEWMHIEKVMDTFLRAQEQKQQEIDALQQANARLASKAAKRKKQNRDYSEMPTTLMAMAALDAARFGVDCGRTPVAQESKVRVRPVVEGKTVQTDEESEKDSKVALGDTKEVQIVEEKTPVFRKPVVQVRAAPTSTGGSSISKGQIPQPTLVASSSQPPAEDKRRRQQENAAMQAIANVVPKLFRRRRLWKQTPWKLPLSLASLETLLPRSTLKRMRQLYGQSIEFQITRGMTANQLRHIVTRTISPDLGSDQIQSFDFEDDAEDEGPYTSITVDQVVLRHLTASVTLVGNAVQIHWFKGELGIEIIPAVKSIPSHAESNKTNESVDIIRAATRVQGWVRMIFAKRKLQRLKAERNLVASETPPLIAVVPVQSLNEENGKNSENDLSEQLAKVKERLAIAMKARASSVGINADSTATSTISDPSNLQLGEEIVVKCLATTDLERAKLSHDAQTRVRQIEARLGALCAEEMQFQSSGDGKPCNLETTRRRLKALSSSFSPFECVLQTPGLGELIGLVFPNAASNSIGKDGDCQTRPLPNDVKLIPAIEHTSSSEIQALADAYECEVSPSDNLEMKPKTSDIPAVFTSATQQPVSRLRHAERAISVARSIPARVEPKSHERPGTPTPDAGRPGTPVVDTTSKETGSSQSFAPVENASAAKVISPFSKTPLISRRANRGAGFQNAR